VVTDSINVSKSIHYPSIMKCTEVQNLILSPFDTVYMSGIVLKILSI